MRLATIRWIPADLWMEIAPILGKEKEPGTKGKRPPVPFREALDGILYVLRIGCQWKANPQHICLDKGYDYPEIERAVIKKEITSPTSGIEERESRRRSDMLLA